MRQAFGAEVLASRSGRTPSGEQPSARAEAQIWTTPVCQDEMPSDNAEVTIEVSKAQFKAGMRGSVNRTALTRSRW